MHTAAEILDFCGVGLFLGCPFGCFLGWGSPSPAPLRVFQAAPGTVYSCCLARIFNFQECKAAGEQQGVFVPPSLWDEATSGSIQDTAADILLWLGAAGPEVERTPKNVPVSGGTPPSSSSHVAASLC